MKKRHSIIWTLCLIPFVGLARAAATEPDALPGPAHDLGEVVVTGTRSETDIRHLPMTVSVVGPAADRRAIQHAFAGCRFFRSGFRGCSSTGRGIMGYGVSGGAAGQMSLRGIGGPAQSGVPTTGTARADRRSSRSIWGCSAIRSSDAYQSLMAERVEVAARSGIGSLRLERYGRSREHRHAQDARGRREELFAYRLRFLQYVAVRTDQPDTQGTLHERRQRLLQPDRRASGEHGLRAVRRLCQAGL